MSETPTIEQPVKNWSLLAQNAFGDGYKGEVLQNAPESDKISEEISEIDEVDQTVEEIEAQPAKEAEVSEEAPISSIEELIRHYEFDPEWVDSLEIPVKINGEEGKAKLADLKNSYQIIEAAQERLNDAKAKAKAETTAIAEKRDQINQQFAAVAALVEKLESKLTSDESGIDWNALRVNDPAEWSAKKSEFADRRAEIDQIKRDAVSSYQKTADASKQEREAALQDVLAEQTQMLMSKLPEWKDPEVAKTERTAIGEYLLSQGLSQEEIGSVYDHRMIVLARKAMLYDKGKDKADLIQHKVTKIPKVLKPGAPKSTEQVSKEKIDQAKSRLQKTGSLDDALALMRQRRG